MHFQDILDQSRTKLNKDTHRHSVNKAKRSTFGRKSNQKSKQLRSTTKGGSRKEGPLVDPGNDSFKVSVEDYFAEGMEKYRQELEAAALAAGKTSTLQKVVTPAGSRTPSWGLLGDALDQQLRNLEMITRACQTDWKWLLMAARWRHARIIASSISITRRRAPATVIEYDLDQPGSLLTRHASATDQVFTKTKSRRYRASRMFDIHYTPTNDKCVDTLDLDFDAHDPNMTYERIGAGRVVRNNFLKIRCSVLVLRWRIRARARLAASSPSRLNSRRSKTSDLLSRSQTPTDLGESLAASEDHQLDQDSSSRSFTGKYIKAEGQPLHERSITSSSEAEDDIPMLRFTGAVLVEDVNQSLQNVAESAKHGEMSRVAKTEGNDSGETNRNDVV